MIILRTLRDDWWKVGAYTGILAFNLIAAILAFPTFEKNWALITNMIPDFLSFLTDAMMRMSGTGGGKLSVFMGINHFFKGANIIGPAAAIVLALGTVVREVELGTIGLLLSRPVRRTRLLLGWALVHVLELTVPLLIITALLPWLTDVLIDRQVELVPFLLAALHGCSFIFLVYAMSLLIAVLFQEQIKVAATAGGLCVVSFMLYFIDATRPFTLYRLSSMQIYIDVVQGNGFPWTEFAVCIALGASLIAAASIVFELKDY